MRGYSPLPTLDRLGLPSFDKSGVDSQKAASEWFASFSCSMNSGNVDAVTSLFIDQSAWRDMLALTWNLRTFQDKSRIQVFLSDCLAQAEVENFVLKTESVTLLEPFSDLVWIRALFDFETKVGLCSGVFFLVPQPPSNGRLEKQQWKAYTVYTSLEGLKGHPEKVGALRNSNANHGGNWQSQREAEVEFANEEPTVVICGAGQAGLNLAARLKVLGVKTLIVEKSARIGDVWRGRYEALCLHGVIWFDHMAYMPFPPTWPVHVPGFKLANWFEHYADSLELNIWLSSTITSATKDANGQWLISVTRNGSKKLLKPSHFVFATGLFTRATIPTYSGMDQFKGQILHSTRYKRATDHAGKKVVVVGAGASGIGLCADYANHDVDVTLYQRSSTYVVSANPGVKNFFAEDALPIEIADRIAAARPHIMNVEYNQRVAKQLAEGDRKLLEGLQEVGFRTNLGPSDAGFGLLSWETQYGYFNDIGQSQLLIDGKIKLKNDAQLQGFTEKGLKFDNGSEIDADVVVFATGLGKPSTYVKTILSPELGDKFTEVWGLDEEGETRGAWRECGIKRLWYMAGNLGQCRFYSKSIALQIKAIEEGLFGERYSK